MAGAKIQITTIDEAEAAMPRYVWIDEDGAQVSPIHKELRSAMHFINGWAANYERVQKERQRMRDSGIENAETVETRADQTLTQLTKSGKPPVKLKRVMIEINVVDPTEEEMKLAEIMKGKMA